MMKFRRGARLGALIASLALFAACGGGDDDDADASEVPEAAAEDDAEDDAEADAGNEEPVDDEGDEDDEAIIVDDIDDIPGECRDAFAEFLQAIEPSVEEVDWDNATMADFEALTTELETTTAGMQDEMDAAGCSDFDFAENEDSINAMIEFARDEAPGTVGYLEFLAGFMEDFSSGADGAPAADLPDDCEGLKAHIEGVIAEHGKMSELPMDELMTVSTAMSEISTKCSLDEANEFFEPRGHRRIS